MSPVTACSAFQSFIPPDWRCPVCKTKPRHKVVLHHDHIEDYVDWLASRHPERARITDFNLLAPFVAAVRGFAPVFICNDCNDLDGSNLKLRNRHQAVFADKFFSFCPAELVTLVSASSPIGRRRARDHAWKLWNRRLRRFRRRLALIERLFDESLMQHVSAAGGQTHLVSALKLHPAGKGNRGRSARGQSGGTFDRIHPRLSDGRRYRQIVAEAKRRKKLAKPEASCSSDQIAEKCAGHRPATD